MFLSKPDKFVIEMSAFLTAVSGRTFEEWLIYGEQKVC